MTTEMAGRLMLGIGVLGLVVTLVAALVAQKLVGDLIGGVDESLELTVDLLETVDESFVVVEEALLIVADGTEGASDAVRALGRGLDDGSVALESARELTGQEIADALEQVEGAMPALQQAAGAIERTLRTLDSLPLGLTYAPERTLVDTIGELRGGLEGIPEQLRDQAAQIEGTADSLTEATAGTMATADALEELVGRLDEAASLAGDYSVQAVEARQLVDAQREVAATNLVQARWMIWIVALTVALGQFVPLYLGWVLRAGRLGPPGPRSDPGTT
ncbi:MAG: hypothetical protein LC679_07835 [Intrasporangiaceae bacterium]|nr:hypothetical protein [Intrasporangiaceae bacterium]